MKRLLLLLPLLLLSFKSEASIIFNGTNNVHTSSTSVQTGLSGGKTMSMSVVVNLPAGLPSTYYSKFISKVENTNFDQTFNGDVEDCSLHFGGASGFLCASFAIENSSQNSYIAFSVSSSTVPLNGKHIITWAWQNTTGTASDFTIWIDHVAQTNKAIQVFGTSYNTNLSILDAGTGPLYIGSACGDTCPSEFSQGSIADIAVYTTKLTQANADTLWNGGVYNSTLRLPQTVGTPFLYFPLDDHSTGAVTTTLTNLGTFSVSVNTSSNTPTWSTDLSGGAGCTPNSCTATFQCGSSVGIDNCGNSCNTAVVGTCTSPQTCGGGGIANTCGGGGGTFWYVRDGGGTASQCTGTTNAVYPGSGSNQPCAYARPMTALGYCTGSEQFVDVPPCTVAGHIQPGDTLFIIGDSDKIPGTQAQYEVGYDDTGSGLTPGCSTGQPSACTIAPIPAGLNSSNPTKVLGVGTHRPQLYGTQATTWVMYLFGNTDTENIEMTEHNSCSKWVYGGNPGYGSFSSYCGPSNSTYPVGAWAQHGMWMDGTNITTKNLWVHNFPDDIIFFPANVSNWNSSNDRFIASGSALVNGCDSGSGCRDGALDMSFGGTNTMDHDVIDFGGCVEKYPLPDPGNYKDLNNYYYCVDQNGGGLGGGFAMQSSTSACGNWNVSNTEVAFNLKTGWDFLHCDTTGTLNFYRDRFEGNLGEALKTNNHIINIESSQLLANAPIWSTAPFQALLPALNGSGQSWYPNICRGGASNLFATSPNEQVNIINSDVEGNCGALLETANLGSPVGYTCPGMAINSYNSKYIAGYDYFDNRGIQTNLLENTGNDGNGHGLCGGTVGAVPLNMHYDSVYNVNDPANCSGTGTLCGTDPKVLAETLGAFTSIFGPTNYYSGTVFGDQMGLQPSSPLKGAGIAGAPFTNGSSSDFNSHSQNSPPDIGALQVGTCTSNPDLCSLNSECCGGTCTGNICNGGGGPVCSPNNGTCSSSAQCCNSFCCFGVCGGSACQSSPLTNVNNATMSGALGS